MRHSSTISFYTLGCKLNFSETSGIAKLFQEKGYARIDFQEGADIVVINTCSVTDQADKKCRNIVKQARRLNENAFIAVIGCYAQLKPNEILSIKGVNIVLGASEKFSLLEKVEAWQEEQFEPRIEVSHIKDAKTFYPSYSIGDRTRSFLKVQDGCDYFCSFCTIPLARGRSRSNSIAATVAQAREVAATDVKEVVLTGVNIGDFGRDSDEDFLGLIKELDKVEGIDRFRISSIEPNLLSNEIIDFVAQSERFVPHFHIPLQSGDDEILKGMRRKYLTSLYIERIERIRKVMPDAAIGVDVICGYPGEDKASFLKTYEYLNQLDVSYLHVFTYSERPNTVAYRRDDHIPMEVRRERSKQLQILSEKKKRHFYHTQVGKKFTVLFESGDETGGMRGFTDNYIKIQTDYHPEYLNTLKQVEALTVTSDGEMKANILNEELVVA
ncbi:MAG: tRNA (N(6)-L-threonylcarbamoyladenosine(37)-C(2))-methylthiotransferase MtaB [Flavobacteriales bacterium]|nr:tRNA (N(6)-L-threonylcarbamoyladenosine(37)-C(2))-methylthiotransferase MtaB [Flavobacteriales bacterium]|tara:strand:- start:430 stop:1752 length:1323 start_codon:yes stop_codon:yes gene_type:complete